MRSSRLVNDQWSVLSRGSDSCSYESKKEEVLGTSIPSPDIASTSICAAGKASPTIAYEMLPRKARRMLARGICRRDVASHGGLRLVSGEMPYLASEARCDKQLFSRGPSFAG